MEDCLFCKIASKQIPAKIVYEDEHALAFLNIHPLSKGHCLVIPKTHSRHFIDMQNEDARALTEASHFVAKLIMKKMDASGMNILANCEKGGGQEIFHTHFHLIPRFNEDGIIHIHREKEDDTPLEIVFSKFNDSI